MRVDCASTELRMYDTKMWILKHPNVYLNNKFQRRLNNIYFHPLHIYSLPEILITTIFLYGVKIP